MNMEAPTLVNLATLIKREDIAEGTMAFHLSRPAGMEFRPGQSIDVTLIDPPETDAEGNTRAFSIASAPSDKELVIATRMRDTAFKRVLRSMPLGSQLKLDGPGGSFTLHRNVSKPAVFLAGGIGITPFLSMALHAAHEASPQQLYLFYSNRRPEDSAFLQTLQDLAQRNANFHFIPTMTEMAKSKRQWSLETGLISPQMIAKHLTSIAGPIFYIAGPPGMVTAMRQLLAQAGADEDDIRTEEFSGY
jgi:ferredoxin-NADP reductase